MFSVKAIFKDTFISFVGVLIILFAVGSYFFNWPKNPNVWLNIGEVITGVILLFTDRKKLAEALIEVIRSKVKEE